MTHWWFVNESLMLSRRNTDGFHVEKHWKDRWIIGVTLKIHQSLLCSMCSWCIIDDTLMVSINVTLVEKKWNSCKILARCLVRSCKRMHYSCRNPARSCKNRFILTSFFQDFNDSYKILANSQCFYIAQNVWDTFLSFVFFLYKFVEL